MCDPESNYQGRPEFSIKMRTCCMKVLPAETCIHLRFQTEIVASKKERQSQVALPWMSDGWCLNSP